jgi:hypothetical protein
MVKKPTLGDAVRVMSRVAHWLANDPGYTRAHAIRQLAITARLV